ncbi:MAG: hypothetical protein WBC36_14285 [Desulfobacterales bacterium]
MFLFLAKKLLIYNLTLEDLKYTKDRYLRFEPYRFDANQYVPKIDNFVVITV